jgi:hypothetical protein
MLNIYSRGDIMDRPSIIEDYDVDGNRSWVVSFKGSNPDGPYSVIMKDKFEAERLVEIISEWMISIDKRVSNILLEYQCDISSLDVIRGY